MNTHATRETKVAERINTQHDPFVEAAAQRLYDSECALHAAHAAGIDEWITAAADRLHEALVAHLKATDLGGSY
jgi:hypothetical protein